jgi:hypothetical protein
MTVKMVKWKIFVLISLTVDISMIEAVTANSNSDSSVAVQALQWLQVRSLGLPHSKERLSGAQDILG